MPATEILPYPELVLFVGADSLLIEGKSRRDDEQEKYGIDKEGKGKQKKRQI